jgi:DNA-binding XRE family transcriptional regulator
MNSEASGTVRTGPAAKMRDELDELIEEWTASDPDLARILDLQSEARQSLPELARRRRRAGLSRTELSRRMGIDEAELVQLERGLSDPRLSTVARCLAIVGGGLRLTDEEPATAARSR